MNEPGTAERYQKAKRIVLEALERKAAARADFVTTACRGDPALHDEVRWLLEAAEDETGDDTPEQFQALTREAVRDVSLTIPLPRDYRLIRRLNEGGMGVVYLAQRADGNIEQRVALKMLHLGEGPDETLGRRLATERQILSRLNHPNIAHLIDGGLTAEGRPFLATEFVDGERIDDWCQQHDCGPKERLRLFLKVCSAVDYAHRHMVIHRDLKPPNILVTPEGEPKLLDFGIARLLDTDEPVERTSEGGGQALTLAYASPEQIRGEGLSAATDVYSLGVLLYQLLTDKRPFDHIESAHLMPNAILAGELTPPEGLPHDLDCIILKAMRRAPAERYESVRELAEDIQRYLDYRPVLARRGHLLYRARRFGLRHRWGVGASLVLGLLLLSFFADREAQLKRIAWERDRAEAVTEFINELFAGANSLPSRGNEVTVREILDLGNQQLASDAANPAVSGSIQLALGRAYNALGLGEQALPLLLEARQALSPSIPLIEQALIQAEIGAALDSAGRAVEAIAADTRALALFEQADAAMHPELIGLRIRKLRNQANIQTAPLDESIRDLNQIIRELEASPRAQGELMFQALSALVGAHVFQGDAERALDTANESLLLADKLYQEGDPRRLRGRHVHATALMLNDPDAAIAVYEELIEDHERLIGPSQRLANTIGNLGVALSRSGRSRDSLAAFEQAAAMIESVAGRDHYLFRLSLANQAALHLRLGEPAEAEALILDIIPDLEQRMSRHGGVETVYLASALDILGSAQSMQAHWPAASESYARALALLETEQDPTRTGLVTNIEEKLAQVEAEMAAGDAQAPDRN